MNKFLEKLAATKLKEPASPASLGIDLSGNNDKELYKWLVATTLFSKPIQRGVASKAAVALAEKGYTSPEAVQAAGWDELVKTLDENSYARFDFSMATTLLNQAKHLKEKYGTLSNLIASRTPDEIRKEIQTMPGIGPLGSQVFVEGLNKKADEKKPLAVIVKGNPKYLNNSSIKEHAKSFYSEIESLLNKQGYTVEYDEGKPYTLPNEKANLWVGHSRGIDRLDFAPQHIKTIALETKDSGKSYKNNDSRGLDPDHYKLSNKDRESLQGLVKKAFLENYIRQKYSEEDWDHLKSPVASKKFDGSHFVLTVHPEGNLTYHSRRQSVKGHYPERSEQLPQLNAKLLPEHAGEQYVVELVHTGKKKTESESHPTLSGILNSKKDRAIATQAEKGPVRAVLIDVKKPELSTYGEKLEQMRKFEKAYGNSDVLYVPKIAKGEKQINKYLDKITQGGGEGIIVTDLNKPEAENPRYKVKNYKTYNLKVIGQQQEIDIHGQPKDSMGALILQDATGRTIGKVGTGFDRETRINARKNPESFHEKLIQVKAYPPSKPGGQIRFPVFNGEADGDIDEVKYIKS